MGSHSSKTITADNFVDYYSGVGLDELLPVIDQLTSDPEGYSKLAQLELDVLVDIGLNEIGINFEDGSIYYIYEDFFCRQIQKVIDKCYYQHLPYLLDMSKAIIHPPSTISNTHIQVFVYSEFRKRNMDSLLR